MVVLSDLNCQPCGPETAYMRHTLDFSQWGQTRGIKPTDYSTLLAKRIEIIIHTISNPPARLLPHDSSGSVGFERGANRSALTYTGLMKHLGHLNMALDARLN